METFFHNIGQVLGTTILHSLWQGLLIYAIIRLGFIAFPAASAGKKYKALYVALSAMAVWFGYTFFIEAKAYNWSAQPAQGFASPVAADIQNTSLSQLNQAVEQPFYYRYQPLLQTYLPYISAIYLLSVLVNLVRLAIGWQKIRSIKKQAVVAMQWQALTSKLSAQAGIVKNVQIYFSKLVDVPCAVGYIKPVLLLPFTISTQLSADEIEVIILHELAHIKNNDYILNLIQQIMTLSLFLNPFARLISNMIDLERENRCDDTVVQIGNPLTYAGALVKLEKTRQQNLQLALAATGKKYHLFDRVKRIMNDDKPVVNIKHLIFGLLIFIGALGSIAWLNPEIENGRLMSKRAAEAINQLKEIISSQPVVNNNVTPQKTAMTVSRKPDSLSNANSEVVADTVLTPAQIAALKSEYRELRKQWERDKGVAEKLPEVKELYAARHIRDSVYASRITPLVSGEIDKAYKEKLKAFVDYQKQYITPKRQLLTKQMQDIFDLHPEMISFQAQLKIRTDSVSNALAQAKGLNKAEVYKTSEWSNWYRGEMADYTLLMAKLRTPKVIAALDSINYLIVTLNQTPKYLELQKMLKTPNPEVIKAQQQAGTGLEQYDKAISLAEEKIRLNPINKKLRADSKRLEEILKQLSGK